MKVSIDTKEDSHEEIKKVIKMLQNLVGDSQEIFSNEPSVSVPSNESPIANIFGDSSSGTVEISSSEQASAPSSTEAKEEVSQSTEDLFAELFSEDELKKMEPVKAPEDEDEEEEINTKSKPKPKKPDIEFY
ncbi:MAG: hypothetical protein AABX25_01865 [Nanoarchaeota archaeon]